MVLAMMDDNRYEVRIMSELTMSGKIPAWLERPIPALHSYARKTHPRISLGRSQYFHPILVTMNSAPSQFWYNNYLNVKIRSNNNNNPLQSFKPFWHALSHVNSPGFIKGKNVCIIGLVIENTKRKNVEQWKCKCFQ